MPTGKCANSRGRVRQTGRSAVRRADRIRGSSDEDGSGELTGERSYERRLRRAETRGLAGIVVADLVGLENTVLFMAARLEAFVEGAGPAVVGGRGLGSTDLVGICGAPLLAFARLKALMERAGPAVVVRRRWRLAAAVHGPVCASHRVSSPSHAVLAVPRAAVSLRGGRHALIVRAPSAHGICALLARGSPIRVGHRRGIAVVAAAVQFLAFGIGIEVTAGCHCGRRRDKT
jgi:hypothetical protein